MKLFLRSMPQPLITFALYQPLIDIACEISDDSDLSWAKPKIYNLLLQLPPCHYGVLFYLCKFLLEMSNYGELTKMDVNNLSIVFASNIMRPPENVENPAMSSTSLSYAISILRILINKVDEIFDLPSKKGEVEEENWMQAVTRLAQIHSSQQQRPDGSGYPHVSELRRALSSPEVSNKKDISSNDEDYEDYNSSSTISDNTDDDNYNHNNITNSDNFVVDNKEDNIAPVQKNKEDNIAPVQKKKQPPGMSTSSTVPIHKSDEKLAGMREKKKIQETKPLT